MKDNYNNITIIFLVGLFLLSCEKLPSKNIHYINGFKYNDPIYQEKIVTALKKNNIPIIISDDEFVTYPDDYINQVNEILKVIDNRPYIEFYEQEYAANFTKLLDDKNIDYSIKYLDDNNIQVYFNKEDDNRVRELNKKNINKIFGRNKL